MGPGVDVCCDLVHGLPFADGSLDAVVAVHLLQDLDWRVLASALVECRRILVPGGWLRVLVPDLERALAAYRAHDHDYFYVRDGEARSIGAKLVTQIVWYGSVRTPMTQDFLAEWLAGAGFIDVRRRAFGESGSADALLASLDNRPRESLCMEARA